MNTYKVTATLKAYVDYVSYGDFISPPNKHIPKSPQTPIRSRLFQRHHPYLRHNPLLCVDSVAFIIEILLPSIGILPIAKQPLNFLLPQGYEVEVGW